MSDQKITEFRERAELGVRPMDPDRLLERGRALRRRRQLAPVAALAAAVAVGYGVYTSIPDPAPSQTPAGQITIPVPELGLRVLGEVTRGEVFEPGTYALAIVGGDDVPDAVLDAVGEGWRTTSSGAWHNSTSGAISWGIAEYRGMDVARCEPGGAGLPSGLSRAQVVDRIAEVPGTRVLDAPSPAPFFSAELPATHLQVSIPMKIRCATELETEPALDSMWGGRLGPRVTVDVWVLEYGDDVLLATLSSRGNPSSEMLDERTSTLESLRFAPLP
ncbi:MAG TPA: hypothetical protein VFY88_16705 [Intrasporangium sp.]|nr:hypothetical protein [Intrasporangium sp.]